MNNHPQLPANVFVLLSPDGLGVFGLDRVRSRFFAPAIRTADWRFGILAAPLCAQHFPERSPIDFWAQLLAHNASDTLNGGAFIDWSASRYPVRNGVRLLAQCICKSFEAARCLNGAAHRFGFRLGVFRFHAHKYTRGVSFAQAVCEHPL